MKDKYLYMFLTGRLSTVKAAHNRSVLPILVLFFVFLAPSVVHAQFRFGVEGGVNISHLKDSKDFFSSDNRTGFFLGPKVCAIIRGVGVGVDIAALYSRMPVELAEKATIYAGQATVNGTFVTDTHNLNYLELPVNLRWNIGSSRLGIYLATGPQFGWFIGDRSFSNIYTNRKTVFEDYLFTWNFGAGVMLAHHIQLGATYNLPVTKAGTVLDGVYQTMDSHNLKNHTWKVRINYFF